MFRAALWIIAQNWKQPKWPSAWEWTNKLWDIHIMENYLTILENKYLCTDIHKTWINLKNMLSKSQTEKSTYQMNLFKIQQHTILTNDNRKPEQWLLLARRDELKGITRELSEVRESFYILIGYWLYRVMWLPRWLSDKEPICQCKRSQRCKVQPLGWEDPWRRQWQPSPVFLPGKIP